MTVRVSDSLSRIERELRALWQPDASGQIKPHATTLNLIAVHGQREPSFLETLDDVAARLGARTFIVSVEGRLEPWALDAEVSAVCRVEPGTLREAVCAERVSLTFGALLGKRAASILASLIEASLPTALFVGPGAPAAVVEALCPEAGVVVLDSAELGLERAAKLAGLGQAKIHDLAFIRGRRSREMLARVFDDCGLRPALGRIRAIDIVHAERPGHVGAGVEAELLIAWLAARLGWDASLRDKSGTPVHVSVQSATRDGVLPGCLLLVVLHAELDAGPLEARIERSADGEHLSLTVSSPGAADQVRRFSVPRRDDAELVERAIRSFRDDELVREALAFAKKWKSHA